MPKWKDLKRFCDNDEWELYKITDHFYYRKLDQYGNLKRTKVSNSSGEIPKFLFEEILKNQLQVSKEYFNLKI